MPDLFTAKPETKSPKKVMPKITTDATLPRGKVNLFTNFRLYPEGLTFENQEEDETLVLFLRRDFATNIPWLVISIFLLFLPFFLSFLPLDLAFSLLTPSYILILNIFYYMLVIGYVLINFTNWFYNISIVTTQRVLDLDYANITYKHVGATTVENIEDISYTQAGFLRSFFDYGTVLVQTKGEIPNFFFQEIPKPAIVTDIILDLVRGKEKND